jgi:HK97 family phage major capsid protein
MKTITQMREEITKIMEDLGKQKALLESEDREPTSEERARAHDFLSRVDELKENIEMEERIRATADSLAEPEVEPTKPEVRTSAIPKAEQEKRDSFLSFGEQLMAVARASMPGERIDRRLTTRAVPSGLGEAVQSDGGFLVQSDFAANLLQNVFETGKLASRVNRISLGAGKNSLKINGIDETSRVNGSRWGGIQMYWKAEADEKTKSKPKFRQIELSLKKLIGLCYATDELLQDAASLESVIKQAFNNELGFAIDTAIFSGSGAGRPLGILNAPSTISQAKETGQTAATVVYENIVKMWSRLLPDSQANSVWLINQNVFPQLATMGLAVGTGGSAVYLPPTGAAGAPYASLMGRPVIPMEQSESVGTSGDIILGDFGKGYIFIDKGGMAQDMSIHVRFIYDESVFRFVYRCDGQPALAKAITPYKGGSGSTLGHFVKLATRS